MVRSKEKKAGASGDAHRSVVETDAAPIIMATIDYERWLKRRIDVVEPDLHLKHEAMAGSLFAFLRATFYRWVSLWQEVCPDLTEAPRVLAVVTSMWRTSELGVIPRVGWSGASMISMRLLECPMRLISFDWSRAPS